MRSIFMWLVSIIRMLETLMWSSLLLTMHGIISMHTCQQRKPEAYISISLISYIPLQRYIRELKREGMSLYMEMVWSCFHMNKCKSLNSICWKRSLNKKCAYDYLTLNRTPCEILFGVKTIFRCNLHLSLIFLEYIRV